MMKGLIGLGGHVVSRVEISPNDWIVVDPDYGVVIPYDIDYIEEHIDVLDIYYNNISNLYNPNYSSKLSFLDIKKIYNSTPNQILNAIKVIHRKDGRNPGYKMKKYGCGLCYFEYQSYRVIWYIPLLLIFPYFLFFLLKFFQKNI